MGFNLIYLTHMRGSYFLYGPILEKIWFFFEKRPFFRVDMAGLGNYHRGGYGRIWVYRVKKQYQVYVKDLRLNLERKIHFGNSNSVVLR